MRVGSFVVEDSVAKIEGVLAEAFLLLRYREHARIPVHHAVLGEFDLVLQVCLGLDEVGKVTTDLIGGG